MKAQKYLRRTACLRIAQISPEGGYGIITINNWTGTVIWGTNENGMEHVSVSPYDHSITPTWDDMCRLKDVFWADDELALQMHPPKDQYVNIMENCLHLWRPLDKAVLEYLEGKVEHVHRRNVFWR